MLGCYFMALKRFAELRAIGDAARAAQYRASFGRYTEMRLLNSVIFYAAASMLTFGAFMMRYRQEWLLAFPLVAWVMSTYFSLSFLPDSPVQKPEALHRQPRLMVAVVLSTVALLVLLAIDLPWLREALAPWGKPSW
jgi:hypothetical protein